MAGRVGWITEIPWQWKLDHPWLGCDEYHGVPGEEPGCFLADRCHERDCPEPLNRGRHKEAATS